MCVLSFCELAVGDIIRKTLPSLKVLYVSLMSSFHNVPVSQYSTVKNPALHERSLGE